MLGNILDAFYDELEKIAAETSTLVISAPKKKDKRKDSLRDRLLRRARGFAAGALPTAAGIRYLIPARDVRPDMAIKGLKPGTHSKLQVIGGLSAGVLGAALAGKDSKSSRVIVQL